MPLVLSAQQNLIRQQRRVTDLQTETVRSGAWSDLQERLISLEVSLLTAAVAIVDAIDRSNKHDG